MRITAEIIVGSALTVIIWSGVLVDRYDLIGRAEFRRLRRRCYIPRPMSARERSPHALAYPMIGRVMPCDGNGWVERDHVSVSGAEHTSRRQCDDQSDCHRHTAIDDHRSRTGGMTVARREKQHRT